MTRVVRSWYSALAVALLLAGLSACSEHGTAPSDAPTEIDVFTPGNLYSPFTATVARGGAVHFHIARALDGDGHNVIFNRAGGGAGAPADVPVVADTVVTRAFQTRGTFPYYCTVHPGMAGEVVVR
jgi:plastocyanin